MEIQRGQRDRLDKYLNMESGIVVMMKVSWSADYDFCCFGLDVADKLSDERYMVFYNQPRSPCSEVTYSVIDGDGRFSVSLGRLPSSVCKLLFAVSIDGDGTMGEVGMFSVEIFQGKEPALSLTLNGADFHDEKAVIAIELYRRDGWRFAAVASGFNGGLEALLRLYGGEEAVAGSLSAELPPLPSAEPPVILPRPPLVVSRR